METVQKAGHIRGARTTQWYIGPANMDGESFTKDELRAVRRFLHGHVPVTQREAWEITKERWTPHVAYYYASKSVWSPGVQYGAYTLDGLLEKLAHYYERMGHVDEELQEKYAALPPFVGN